MNYRLRGGLTGKVMLSWEVIDDADLEYHVRRSALPYPGGERELGELVSRLHSNPMDLAKPLWEFHVIEGLAGHRFAIYCKVHHALVDGANSVKLLNLTTIRTPVCRLSGPTSRGSCPSVAPEAAGLATDCRA